MGDVVGDFFEDAWDFVEDVGEWVIDIGSSIVESIKDDPISFVIKTATAFIAPQLLPLVNAADTALKGGDFGDVLLSAATTYVGQQIGPAVGKAAGNVFTDVVGQEFIDSAVGEIAIGFVEKGAGSTFNAVLLDQDPFEAFLTGGITQSVNAIAGKVATELGFVFDEKVVSDLDDTTFGGEGPTPIPASVMNIITSSATAALTGRDVTPELMATVALRSTLTADTVSNLANKAGIDLSKPSDSNTLNLVTKIISDTATAVVQTGNPEIAGKAFTNAIGKYGVDKLVDTIRNTDFGNAVSEISAKISGSYDEVAAKARAYEERVEQYNDNILEYQSLEDTYLPNYERYKLLQDPLDFSSSDPDAVPPAAPAGIRMFKGYEQQPIENDDGDIIGYGDDRNKPIYTDSGDAKLWTWEDSEFGGGEWVLTEAGRKFRDDYRQERSDLGNQISEAWNAAKPRMTELADLINGAQPEIDKLQTELLAAQKLLTDNAESLSEELNPVVDRIYNDIATSFDPDFNGEEYKEINNLEPGVDAASHYINNLGNEYVYTNQAAYDKALDENAERILNLSIARSGVNPGNIEKSDYAAQLEVIKETLSNMPDAGSAALPDSFQSALDASVAATTYDVNRQLESIKFNMADPEQRAKYVGSPWLDKLTDDIASKLTGAEKPNEVSPLVFDNLSDEDIKNGNFVVRVNSEGVREVVSSLTDVKTTYEPVYNPNFGLVTREVTRSGNQVRTVFKIDDDDLYYEAYQNALDEGASEAEARDAAADAMVVFDVTSQNPNGLSDEEQIKLMTKYVGVDEIEVDKTWAGFANAIGLDPDSNLGNYIKDLLVLDNNIDNPVLQDMLAASIRGGAEVAKGIVNFATVASYAAGDALTRRRAYLNAIQDGMMPEEAAEYADEYVKANASNPFDSGAYKALNAFSKFAGALNTNEAKAAAEELYKGFSQRGKTYDNAYKQAIADGFTEEEAEEYASGARDGLSTYERLKEDVSIITGSIKDNPSAFMLDFLAVEAASEVVPLVVGGGSYTVAKQLLKNKAEDYAKKIAAGAGLGTAAITDIAEAGGATAEEAYNTAKREALKKGMSEADAEMYALNMSTVGLTTGVITTALSYGVGGFALEKTLWGNKAQGNFVDMLDELGNRAKDGLKVITKEIIAEGSQEAVASAIVKARINNDIGANLDVSQEATKGALLGGLVGGAVTTGGVAVKNSADLVTNIISQAPQVQTIIQNAVTQFNDSNQLSQPTIDNIRQELAALGIDTTAQNDVLGIISPDQFVSSGVVEKLANQVANDQGYTFTVADINNFTGEKTDANTFEGISKFADDRAVTTQEVIDRAAAEGVTITEEQAQEFVGRGDTELFDENTMKMVDAKYDPLATTRAEAQEVFNRIGYTPTTAELDQFAKEGNETEILDSIAPYVDPRQITYDEAKKYLTDLNFDPTEEQIKSFIGQGDANFQTSTGANIATYVDARQVTEAEAKKFFADLGFDPTEEQLNQFIGQGGANFQTLTADNISAYVDPRQVTYTEAQKYFTDLGFEPSEEQINQFIGQGGDSFQTETGTQISAYVNPRQVTEAEARKFFTDLGFEPSEEQINQFIGQGDDTFEASIKEKVAPYIDPRQITYDEARQILIDNGVSNPTSEQITQFVGQGDADFQTTSTTNIADYADPLVVTEEEVRAAYAEQGLDRPLEGDITKLVGEYDESTLGTKIEENLDTARFNLTSADIAEVKDIIGAPAGTRPLTIDDAQEIMKVALGVENKWGLAAGLEGTNPDALAALDLNKDGYVDVNDALIVAGIAEGQITGEEAEAFISGSILEQDLQTPATGLFKTIADNEATGIARDEAISNAVDTVASDLNTTREDLLNRIGVTEDTLLDTINTSEETLRGEITGVETSLGEQITGVETSLGEQITGVETTLGEDIAGISQLLGKPAQEVTQADYDTITDYIASNIVLNEQQTKQYDVNADGVVDATDQALLGSALAGEQVQFADTSVYSPTGMYKTLFDQQMQAKQDQQTLLDQLTQQEQDFKTQLESQLETTTDLITKTNTDLQDFFVDQMEQAAEKEKQAQSAQRGRRFLSSMFSSPGYSVETKQVDPLQLGYIYDFSSIFANPQQESLFASPYRKGGQVNSTTDKLLQIIGESK